MQKVVMLVGSFDDFAKIMYNALKLDFNIAAVIEETNESTQKYFKRRIKKLGWPTVIGQIAFMLLNKQTKKQSQSRIKEIMQGGNLNDAPYDNAIFQHVESVNSPATIAILQQLEPDAVVVNGTRIISEKVLNSVTAPFINTHAGITPKYRGVHGGYWALTQKDLENCGVTIHLVDKGVDTGDILYQDKIQISDRDNFNTYPYLQYAAAVPMMKQAVTDALHQDLKPQTRKLSSKQWYHPTIWEYSKYWIFEGIK